MFLLYANKNQLIIRKREAVTSGSVGIYPVQFAFSADWDGLSKTAVFRAGTVSRSILLTGNETVIPWEVLEKSGFHLQAGVYGTRGEEMVLPTVWADLGVILEGVSGGAASKPPTPGVYEQILEMLKEKADALLLDGVELQLLAGDYPLSTVILPSGGGEGGTSDHRQLTGRDAAGQHPIESVSNLREELNRIPRPVEPLTNQELEGLLT
ncbi:MAG: hypothetical protein HFH26_11840 [Clostridiaceae bacterium]|nr:hypothetical protein [Clostridiaceae bacterium]